MSDNTITGEPNRIAAEVVREQAEGSRQDASRTAA